MKFGKVIMIGLTAFNYDDDKMEELEMKIILSRKGFDSAAGGYANPILPDGTLLSLPIPDESSAVCFSDLSYKGKSYYEIMGELHGTKMKEDGKPAILSETSGCHLVLVIYSCILAGLERLFWWMES
jgi:hypothetical protein